MASGSEALALAACEAAKSRGNDLFKAGEYALAIREYTSAIELEPPGYKMEVLYSNRSGAYLASGDAKSKALKDAEKCVELAPEWAKGYGRLGAAQHALCRYADAQASYLKARDMDPDNSTYESGLQAAKDGEAKATAARIAAEQEAARAEAAREAAANEARRAKEADDSALQSFFAAVGDAEQARKRATRPINDKYAKQDLGSASFNIERLTEKFAEFKNLNPYVVLALDTDATVDDIKMRYRKLSALCHPDKNLDKPEEARAAFEAVKTAYQHLTDDKVRDRTILVIQGARERAKLQHQNDSSVQLEQVMAKEVMKTFAQNEMKRRDVEEHKRVQAARERQQADEEKKKEDDEKQFEQQWNQDDRRNTRVEFWQRFQDDTDRSGNQKRIRTARNFKMQQQEHKKAKYGQVELETWKKDWK